MDAIAEPSPTDAADGNGDAMVARAPRSNAHYSSRLTQRPPRSPGRKVESKGEGSKGEGVAATPVRGEAGHAKAE